MRHPDCKCRYPHATLEGCKRQRLLARNVQHSLDENVKLKSAEEIASERAERAQRETPPEPAAIPAPSVICVHCGATSGQAHSDGCPIQALGTVPQPTTTPPKKPNPFLPTIGASVFDEMMDSMLKSLGAHSPDCGDPDCPVHGAHADDDGDVVERPAKRRQKKSKSDEHERRTKRITRALHREAPKTPVYPQIWVAVLNDSVERLNESIRELHKLDHDVQIEGSHGGGIFGGDYLQLRAKVVREL